MYIGILSALFYYASKYLLPKTIAFSSSRFITLRDKKVLTPHASLYVIEYNDKHFLIGVTDQEMRVIDSSSGDIKEIDQPVATSLSFKEILDKLIPKKSHEK